MFVITINSIETKPNIHTSKNRHTKSSTSTDFGSCFSPNKPEGTRGTVKHCCNKESYTLIRSL